MRYKNCHWPYVSNIIGRRQNSSPGNNIILICPNGTENFG